MFHPSFKMLSPKQDKDTTSMFYAEHLHVNDQSFLSASQLVMGTGRGNSTQSRVPASCALDESKGEGSQALYKHTLRSKNSLDRSSAIGQSSKVSNRFKHRAAQIERLVQKFIQ